MKSVGKSSMIFFFFVTWATAISSSNQPFLQESCFYFIMPEFFFPKHYLTFFKRAWLAEHFLNSSGNLYWEKVNCANYERKRPAVISFPAGSHWNDSCTVNDEVPGQPSDSGISQQSLSPAYPAYLMSIIFNGIRNDCGPCCWCRKENAHFFRYVARIVNFSSWLPDSCCKSNEAMNFLLVFSYLP